MQHTIFDVEYLNTLMYTAPTLKSFLGKHIIKCYNGQVMPEKYKPRCQILQ